MKLWLIVFLKKLGEEVKYSDSSDLQVIGLGGKIQVPQFTWPSTNIQILWYTCQFFCLHPNFWLGGSIYLKFSYVIETSLVISRGYGLVC